MEDEGTDEEGDKDAAATYHGDDGYQGLGEAQSIEIDKVSSTKEDGDEGDGAFPC